MAIENLRTSLSRITALSWEYDDSKEKIYLSFMRKYLENVGRLRKSGIQNTGVPFFDLREALDLACELPAEIERDFEAWAVDQLAPKIVIRTCHWYLASLACGVTPGAEDMGGGQFYEPLIRMFEEGGFFYLEHGYIVVGMAAIPYALGN